MTVKEGILLFEGKTEKEIIKIIKNIKKTIGI